jgi:prepilin-type N-terminal cleavage/methylation domain-containing protein
MSGVGPKQAGFSLIEVLIALAVAAVLGIILTQLYASSNQAQQVQQTISALQENKLALAELLQSELRLAGSKDLASLTVTVSPTVTATQTVSGTSCTACLTVSYAQAGQVDKVGFVYLPSAKELELQTRSGSAASNSAPAMWGVSDFSVYFLTSSGSWTSSQPSVGNFAAIGVYFRLRSHRSSGEGGCQSYPSASAGLPASPSQLGIQSVTPEGASCQLARTEDALAVYPASPQSW